MTTIIEQPSSPEQEALDKLKNTRTTDHDAIRDAALEEAAVMVENGMDTQHPIVEGAIMRQFKADPFWAKHIRSLKSKKGGA